MAKRVIEMDLSTASIAKAIAELKSYRDSLEAKMDKLVEELAKYLPEEVKGKFV